MSDRVLYLDCFSGISGDMMVGALLDLGWPESVLRQGLTFLGIDEEFHLHLSRQMRQNIEGVKFDVHVTTAPEKEHPSSDHAPHTHDHAAHSHSATHQHSHDDPHHHTHGRSFREIQTLLTESRLPGQVVQQALAIFERIAIAEGKIHGMPPGEVTFHEVGAVDSIIDIVATCLGLHWLGVTRVFASTPVEGSGWIDCAHGRFPLPAPATMEILSGIPIRQVEDEGERITPTGAALLAVLAKRFGPMPEIAVEKIGYGIGSRNPANRPNVLRAILGKTAKKAEPSDHNLEEVVELQTNLDDCTPELAGELTGALFREGALDVSITPALMKKGRPGFLLTVLCPVGEEERFALAILRRSSSFGVRWQKKNRLILDRRVIEVETPHGKIKIKVGSWKGEVFHKSPEYESCRELAEARNVTFQEVYSQALAAAATINPNT